MKNQFAKTKSMLLATVAICAMDTAAAQETNICNGDPLPLPEECVQGNAQTVVGSPANPNTEFEARPITNNAGFALSIDGQQIDSDPTVENLIRTADLALAKADIRVSYDGLGAVPRLAVEFANENRAYAVGDTVVLQSRLNYPAFVTRGEIRLFDLDAAGGPRLLATSPIDPNGQLSMRVPDGNRIAVVHRVYDERGRFDETEPFVLTERDTRGLVAGVEDGVDTAAIRRIPVRGGAVTVSSNNVQRGATVSTLGERITPDASGSFVVQRILPPGDYDVRVQVTSGEDITREVEIKNAEWFYVGIVDLTYGYRQSDDAARDGSYTKGRVAVFAEGTYANGTEVIASLDTQEGELDELFSNVLEKDPNSVLSRIDPRDVHATFGDDSSTQDLTPSSGKVYVRVEREGDYFMLGDFRSEIGGNDYVQGNRSLYGVSAKVATKQHTKDGEPRASLSVYAADAGTLQAREIFRGTGGSLYFLERQDILRGSETLTVVVRDTNTGRVLERRTLVLGRDYTVNSTQGSIVLTQPLEGFTDTSLLQTTPGGDVETVLIAQYEYTPTLTDPDSLALGARAEFWPTETLRFGVSATSEETETGEQTTVAADVLLNIGKNSYVRLDYAKTEGSGIGTSFSNDGGLIIDDQATASGTGEAINLDVKADFGDLGLAANGFVAAYFEKRTEGFSTLDTQVLATTGDETLWGISTQVQNGNLAWNLAYDDYKNGVGDTRKTAALGIDFAASDALQLSLGLQHLETTGSTTGQRTDVAARVTYALSDATSIYAFGQTAIGTSTLAKNDRYGIGLQHQVNDAWRVEGEISDGSFGLGGRIAANYQDAANNSLYFGYEIDPAEQRGSGTYGTDQGRYILGGRRQVNDNVAVFAENTYDVFGRRTSLTSVYGVNYAPSDYLSYDVGLEMGRVRDDVDGDFDRRGVTFAVNYEDEDLTARGKFEYRKDEGVLASSAKDSETVLLSFGGRYKISESSRFVFDILGAKTNTDQSSIRDGELYDVRLGYAHRPVDNERLNTLLSYRYLHDDYGQRIDGTDVLGPRQRSHVLNFDISYDLNPHWTLGGKLAVRKSQTAATPTDAFVDNDAVLAVINARYHLVHNWDFLVEGRVLDMPDNGTRDVGALAAVYRHVNENIKVGVGYNFGSFSDDLTDLVQDDQGAFVNLIAKF